MKYSLLYFYSSIIITGCMGTQTGYSKLIKNKNIITEELLQNLEDYIHLSKVRTGKFPTTDSALCAPAGENEINTGSECLYSTILKIFGEESISQDCIDDGDKDGRPEIVDGQGNIVVYVTEKEFDKDLVYFQKGKQIKIHISSSDFKSKFVMFSFGNNQVNENGSGDDIVITDRK